MKILKNKKHRYDDYVQKILDAGYSIAVYEENKEIHLVDVSMKEEMEESVEEVTVEESSELDRAKALIDEFFDREYNASIEDSDNMSVIGLAYTKLGDEEYEIQVNVNLEEYRVERYLDGKLFDSMQFESLAELNDSFLSDLSFDELVYVDDDELSRFLEDEGRKMPVPEVKDEQKETPIYEIAPTELGKDDAGNVRQCSVRATDGSVCKKEVAGSDRGFCFNG